MQKYIPNRWRAARWSICAIFTIAILIACVPATRGGTLTGEIRAHDPSTVIQCDGRYYVYCTGRGISVLSSADGYDWKSEPRVFDQVSAPLRAAVPKNDGQTVWAPDITKLNGEYYMYYAVSSWGSNVSAIGLATNPTLNPADQKFEWTDRGVVIASHEGEQLNCIDPGIIQSPDGTLWMCYGSYIGDVEIVQLDSKTGLRIKPDSPTTKLSAASEASDIIQHGDYFYLFVNRGSCCKGVQSTYNIRVGRSKTITGPYLDRYGVDMMKNGGDLFLASQGKRVGPGHFGLVMMDGLERFSCHWEGDPDHGGRSILDIRPLVWTDGWPAAGDEAPAGNHQIGSVRPGIIIEASPPAPPDGKNAPGAQASYITTTIQK